MSKNIELRDRIKEVLNKNKLDINDDSKLSEIADVILNNDINLDFAEILKDTMLKYRRFIDDLMDNRLSQKDYEDLKESIIYVRPYTLDLVLRTINALDKFEYIKDEMQIGLIRIFANGVNSNIIVNTLMQNIKNVQNVYYEDLTLSDEYEFLSNLIEYTINYNTF